MQINTKLTEAKWIDYPDDKEVKFKIKPFPMSKGMWIPGTEEDVMEFGWKRFNYSIVDWRGLNDEEGNPLECNEENKHYIYDYVQALMMWVTTQIVNSTESIIEKKT